LFMLRLTKQLLGSSLNMFLSSFFIGVLASNASQMQSRNCFPFRLFGYLQITEQSSERIIKYLMQVVYLIRL
jgi:hypothetical protein